jgi:hypothetical protein
LILELYLLTELDRMTIYFILQLFNKFIISKITDIKKIFVISTLLLKYLFPLNSLL